jgi:hypothetical protein
MAVAAERLGRAGLIVDRALIDLRLPPIVRSVFCCTC